jgi:hypothetical protein
MRRINWLHCDVYNGSTWKIYEVTVAITVLDPKGGEVLSRNYKLIGAASPLEDSDFQASLGFSVGGPRFVVLEDRWSTGTFCSVAIYRA